MKKKCYFDVSSLANTDSPLPRVAHSSVRRRLQGFHGGE
jgi:hypothetical protein